MATNEDSRNKDSLAPRASDLIDLDDDDRATRIQVQTLSITGDGANASKDGQNQEGHKEDLPPAYHTDTTRQSMLPFKAADYVIDGSIHVLVAGSGSLATGIIPVIVDGLEGYHQVKIRIVLDKAALRHVSVHELLERPHVDGVYTDDDWHGPNSYLEYELRGWVDFMLVAPCSHRIFRNIATGGGDDLLSTILRVFDHNAKLNPPGSVGRFKHISVAPAMDSVTWAHPVTLEHKAKMTREWSQSRSPSGKVSWARVMWPRGYPDADFDCFEDNCNIDVASILHEAMYQVDKFRSIHPEYAPGK